MTNPFDVDIAPVNSSNPFDADVISPSIGQDEIEVISATRDMGTHTPESFGFTNLGKGFISPFAQSPQNLGSLLKQLGASASKGDSFADIAKRSLIESYFSDKENAINLGVIGTFAKLEKDIAVGAISKLFKPNAIIDAGDRLIESNKKYIEESGLSRPLSGGGAVAYDIGSALSSSAVSVGLTMVTKNPTYAAGYMGYITQTSAYTQAIDAGKSPQDAFKIATSSAYGQAGIELIGGKVFQAAALGSSLFKKIAVRTLGQGLEEGAQQGVEEVAFGATGVTNKAWDEIAQSIGYSAVIGLIAGAPVTTVASYVENRALNSGLSEKSAKKVAENFINNHEEMVDAAARIIDNEASGLASDKEQVAEAIKILRGEIPTIDIEQEISYRSEARSILSVLKEAEKAKLPYSPLSISAFIKKNGGIVDIGEELAARGVYKKSYVGLVRKEAPDLDAIRQKLFDAGYFPDAKNYNEITDSQIYDAIASDVSGKRIYDRQTNEIISSQDEFSRAIDSYAQRGIYKHMSETEVSDILKAELGAKTEVKTVSPDMNDPRFSGEADYSLNDSSVSFDTVNKAADDKARFYNEIIEASKVKKKSTPIKDTAEAISSAMGYALTPISTRLNNINPKFSAMLRKFERDKAMSIEADGLVAKNLIDGMKKLNPADLAIFDVALKNSDIETINEIASKNNLDVFLKDARNMLNSLYTRAEKVGINIGYRKDYFPRLVKDSKGLLSYFEQSELWGEIQEAFRQKEMELGEFLSTEEKAHLINALMAGESQFNIFFKPGFAKARNIDIINAEINQFYEPSTTALARYVVNMNEAIEMRRLFGKTKKNPMPTRNSDDDVATFVLDQFQKGNITAGQIKEVSELFKARFAKGKMNAILRNYKNFSYIDTMGSPISAITQLSGLSYSLANNGFYNTFSALAGKNKVSLEEIGVTNIAAEIDDVGTTSKAVKMVFDAVGLSALDRLDKHTFINSTLKQYQKSAKKNPDNIRKAIQDIFDNETDSVISDLQEGRITENVKLLLFNELSNMQPITLSEMPEAYLRNPNGRIFYMLKTFTIKQYDVYRRQVFKEISEGNTRKGLTNLVRLTYYMMLMNAGADFLKDLILGRETELEDVVITNIARVAGFSKYQVYSVKREGLGTAAVKTILPPFKLIDSTSKDMVKAINNGEVNMDEIESVNSVPVVGKFYYWWFGAGSYK